MGRHCNLFLTIFAFKLLIELGNFICICIIVDSSKKNPFDSYSIINLTNYFYDAPGSTIPYNNSLINDTRTEEHTLNRKVNISSDLNVKKGLFLRKLVSESTCLEIRENFEKLRGKTLSSIFDFNFNKIKKLSITILVLYIILFVFLIINACLINAQIYYRDYKCCVIFYLFIFLLIYGSRFVLFLVLLYFMEKGDIEKYDDFLECPHVKVKFFKSISNINKNRGSFYAFTIMNFLLLGIEKIENYLEFSEKSIQEGKITFNKNSSFHY